MSESLGGVVRQGGSIAQSADGYTCARIPRWLNEGMRRKNRARKIGYLWSDMLGSSVGHSKLVVIGAPQGELCGWAAGLRHHQRLLRRYRPSLDRSVPTSSPPPLQKHTDDPCHPPSDTIRLLR